MVILNLHWKVLSWTLKFVILSPGAVFVITFFLYYNNHKHLCCFLSEEIQITRWSQAKTENLKQRWSGLRTSHVQAAAAVGFCFSCRASLARKSMMKTTNYMKTNIIEIQQKFKFCFSWIWPSSSGSKAIARDSKLPFSFFSLDLLQIQIQIMNFYSFFIF